MTKTDMRITYRQVITDKKRSFGSAFCHTFYTFCMTKVLTMFAKMHIIYSYYNVMNLYDES